MREWTESSLIKNLPAYEKDTSSARTQALARFIVTLYMFKIWKDQLLIEELGPRLWEYSSNYYMYRYYMTPVDLNKFT